MDPADDAASEEGRRRLGRKMHSLYFPAVWREAVVSPINLMLFAGKCRDANDAALFEQALMPFQNGDLPEAERAKYRALVQQEAAKTLITPQTGSPFLEVAEILMMALMTNR